MKVNLYLMVIGGATVITLQGKVSCANKSIPNEKGIQENPFRQYDMAVQDTKINRYYIFSCWCKACH